MKHFITTLLSLVCFLGCGSGTFEGLQQFSSIAHVIPSAVVPSQCTSSDGTVYDVTHIKASGPFTSAVLGNGTLHADAYLLHGPDGRGISYDNVTVDNPDGSLKFKGLAVALDQYPGQPIVGVVYFEMADGRIGLTGTTVTLPAQGVQAPIVIEYGNATPNVQQLGYIIDGECASFISGLQ